MRNDTKEKILDAALAIFARDGYDGTNIKDIAESVGLVKSAFYRHYASKEEVWDAVYEMTSSYYNEHFGSADSLSHIPDNTDELYEMTMRMVNFTVRDEKVVMMRKIFMTEQFRDERFRKLATRYFIDDTKVIFIKVFDSMMKADKIKQANIEFLAFSYTAPITELIHLCDRAPERIDEIVAEIESFVRAFIDVYEVKK